MKIKTNAEIEYHQRQWDSVYQSTEAFAEFLKQRIKGDGAILDVGCGAGGATAFLARAMPSFNFTGIDVCEQAVELGRKK